VRIAELTVGAEAILLKCKKIVDKKEPVLLGLPYMSQPIVNQDCVYLNSLFATEYDVQN
jgi:hypothetical protein